MSNDAGIRLAQGEHREYSYREFTNFTRRFDQEELLFAVARAALEAPPRISPDPRSTRTPLWALAATVKASICHGNRFRSTRVTPRDVLRGCLMYNNLRSDELDQPELNSGFAILVRLMFEQFPYQISSFEEVCRLEALFSGYSGRKRLEVVTDSTLADLLGAPLIPTVGVAMILHVSAQVNGGLFDPAWMDQSNFQDVLAVVPRRDVESVIRAVFSTTFEEFALQAAETPALEFLDQYMFNPLTARPLVQLRDGRYIAPVPQLILRKLSPLELYYPGLDRWGQAFARDMGELFEDYVGRQLRHLPDAVVHAEISYRSGKNTVDGVDWIVVFDNLVLLVEAKATRASASVRAGDRTATEPYQRILGKGFNQINRMHRAILAGAPELAHIPTDRPFLGLVSTLDAWPAANNLARPGLPDTDVPTMVASARDIEALVSAGQRRSASEILLQIMTTGDQLLSEFGPALGKHRAEGDRNPLLDQAWARYPFGHRAAQRRATT
ncbi:hypothetical protein [Longispora urticae]